MRNLNSLLVASALSALVAPAAVAQQAAPPPRTVAVYEIDAPRRIGMPTQIAVTDSAGTLSASFTLRGTPGTRPMLVEFIGGDIVLQGETPAGTLTFVLFQRDPTPVGAVIGRWIRGDNEGKLMASR